MPQLESLVRAYAPAVNKMARRLIGQYSGWFKDPDGERADLIQVALLRLVIIYPNIDFSNKGHKAFILRSLHGVMLNHIVKNIPHILSHEQFIKLLSLDDMVDAVEEPYEASEDVELSIDLLMFKRELLALITEFMTTITPIERFVLLSRFIDHKTYAEIGKSIGRSRKGIPKRIIEIVKCLGQFLEQKKGWSIHPDDMIAYLQDTDFNL